MKSLDDLFNDNPDAAAEESAPVVEPNAEPGAKAAPVDQADPKPDEAKSEGEEPAADASDESTGVKKDSSPESEVTVPISAMHGERDRRQAAERELAELKRQLESSEEQKREPVSVFEDEEGFVHQIEQRFQGELINRTLNESQFHAEQKFGADALAAKVETFKQLVADNPAYAEQFASSVSPYFTLVDIVDKHQELEAIKDIDAYKAKLRAEAKAEVLAELDKEKAAKQSLRDSVPESLVGEGSKGGLKGTSWTGPTSLESLLD